MEDETKNREEDSLSERVAVIGMSGRFPGADCVAALWQNLRRGVSGITRFGADELLAAGLDPELVHDPRYVRANARVADIDRFDAALFGFTPQEAALMDPQHRLFLECAWEAFEHAGWEPAGFDGAVGVFAGVGLNTYLLENLLSRPSLLRQANTYHLLTGNDKDFVPTRVSYKLNLRGPSLNVNTACSSSLVAVHLACLSLLSYQSDLALAGGVRLQANGLQGYLYQEGGIFSPDGTCRPFDARAQGTVAGSGVGVVVLKRLSEALADGDTIYGVILGGAMNNDGAGKAGFTAPGFQGQVDVIREALEMAEAGAETIGYVEAHGTATPLGDGVEVAALHRVFAGLPPNTCALGSLKSVLGHLDAAAGVAGLIKALLAVRHGEIPATLGFETPSPRIDFSAGPFYVNSRLRPWPAGPAPRRAGISSFGIGGTNVHLVIEEPPPPRDPAGPGRPVSLLLLSAATETALASRCRQLAACLRENPAADLADVAFTLSAGRRHLAYRKAVVGSDPAELVRRLSAQASDGAGAADLTGRPVAFLIPGQGVPSLRGVSGLYQGDAAFQAAFDRCALGLRAALGLDLRDLLGAEAGVPGEPRVVQPLLFSICFAMAELWKSWGVQPAALLGHSLGELVAACLAGVFPFEEALEMVAVRGRLTESCPAGAMLAVPLAEDRLREMLTGSLALAAVNGPQSCVVSGLEEEVVELESRLSSLGSGARRLPVSRPYHSPLLGPALRPFQEHLGKMPRQAPALPLLSTLTGDWMTPEQATDPAYWARHLVGTVRFSDALGRLLSDPGILLLEVGPGRALGPLARRHPAGRERVVLTTSPARGSEALAHAVDTLGRFWTAGAKVDISAYHRSGRRIPLPTYPFEGERHWIEARPATSRRGLDPWRRARRAEPSWPHVTAAPDALERQLKPELESQVPEHVRQRYRELFLRTEHLSFLFAVRALRALGGTFRLGEVTTFETWASRGGVRDKHRRLLARLLEIVSEEGVLQPEGDAWRVTDDAPVDDPTVELEKLRQKSPEAAADLDLLGRCGGRLAEMLRGEVEGLELLFPGGDSSALRQLYADSLGARVMSPSVTRVVAEAIRDRPPGALLRVLEIGAGTGALTRLILPLLPATARYTFSDVASLLLSEARSRFGEDDRLRFRLLDIEKDPAAQGEPTPSYDLVIAGNVLHATRDLRQSLRHVRDLLLPGGLLILLEGNRPVRAGDLVAGGLDGWWRFTDSDLRPKHPLLSETQWRVLLHEMGFDPVGVVSPDRAGEEVACQSVVLARSASEPSDAVEDRRWLVFLDRQGLGAGIAEALRWRGHRVFTVTRGTRFQSLDGESFQIAPDAQDDYRQLLGTVASTAGKAARDTSSLEVVHLWALDAVSAAVTTIETLEAGVTSTLSGLEGLLASLRSFGGGVRCVLVTRGTATVDRHRGVRGAAQEPLWERAREETGVACLRLDLAPKPRAGELAELVAELVAAPPPSAQPEAAVALRGEERFVVSAAPPRTAVRTSETNPAADVERRRRPPALGSYLAPKNDRERRLAELWSELLGVDPVGVDDNFFDLGGDSVIGIQLAARLREAGMEIAIESLLQHQTIAELAATIGGPQTGAEGPASGEVPLSPIQRWFFELAASEPSHFNQSLLCEVPGDLQIDVLRRAWEHVQEHHDALRARFEATAAGWRQEILESVEPASWVVISLPQSSGGETFRRAAQSLQASLDILRGPVARAALLLRDKAPWRLLLVVHHLVIDSWSWRFLLADLEQAYQRLAGGEPAALPPKTTSFRTWSRRLQSLAEAGGLRDELPFWRAQRPRPLPVDFEGAANLEGDSRVVTFLWDRERTRSLTRDATRIHRAQVTELLLTALLLAVTEDADVPSLSVDMEGHGRDRLAEGIDVSRTLGWFTALYPLRLTLDRSQRVEEVVAAVREQVRQVPLGGRGFGALRYLDSAARQELGAFPRAPISFLYLGAVGIAEADVALELKTFRPLAEPAGRPRSPADRRPYLLSVDACLEDGRLKVDWGYGDGVFRRETIERLSSSFERALRSLLGSRPREAAARRPVPDGQASSLVALSPGEGGRPLFCVPGAGGSVVSLWGLARHSGGRHPFYAFQAPGLRGEASPPDSVESAAACYVRDLLRAEPGGPYLLAGHSFGVRVAYEMSQQLLRAGKEVARLLAIDGPAPLATLRLVGAPRDERGLLQSALGVLERLLQRPLGIDLDHFLQLDEDEQHDELDRKLSGVDRLPDGLRAAEMRGFLNVFRANLESQASYVAHPTAPVPVTLFRARDVHAEEAGALPVTENDPTWGWHSLAAGEVEVIPVPGDHLSIMNDPFVRELGEQLRRCCERFDPAEESPP